MASSLRMQWLQRLSCVMSLCLLLSGCGGNQKVAPVTGKVTLDGAPIEHASVLFQPEKGGRPSFGVTDQQGRYKLAYSRSQNGAYVGSCVVKIAKLPDSRKDGGDTSEKASESAVRIPERYTNEPVKVTVLPKHNTIDIGLTSKP